MELKISKKDITLGVESLVGEGVGGYTSCQYLKGALLALRAIGIKNHTLGRLITNALHAALEMGVLKAVAERTRTDRYSSRSQALKDGAYKSQLLPLDGETHKQVLGNHGGGSWDIDEMHVDEGLPLGNLCLMPHFYNECLDGTWECILTNIYIMPMEETDDE